MSSSSSALLTEPQPQTEGVTDSRQPLLAMHDLHKTFPDRKKGRRQLFAGLGMEVYDNEIVAIIGHSGCGKSTILSMIAGLEPFDQGRIELQGQPVTRPGSDRMMVFQNYSLLSWLSAADNIRLALDEVMPEKSRAERQAIVDRYIRMMHLEEAVHKRPHELSGGMKQRVGIARALAVEPKLLLMDEPFGALDPFTRGRLQDQVLELFYQLHQAILLVTHDVDEAIYMADRIIVLQVNSHSSVAQTFQVPFAHPRDRRALREEQAYHDLRNDVLDLLEQSQG